jgi:hypothetical protein
VWGLGRGGACVGGGWLNVDRTPVSSIKAAEIWEWWPSSAAAGMGVRASGSAAAARVQHGAALWRYGSPSTGGSCKRRSRRRDHPLAA